MRLSSRFEAAFQLAHQLHADQLRKGSTTPYIAHLMAVTAMVLEHGGGEDEAIAALLHDAAEDQGGEQTLDRIRAEFGERVAGLVAACSDAMGYPRPPWQLRKQRFLEALAAAEPGVRLIMTADKLHNVQTIIRDLKRDGPRVWLKFRGDRDGTLWYYRAALQALQTSGSGPLLEELARAVAELETLAAADQRGMPHL